MGFLGRLTAHTKADYRVEIAEVKCKMIDAKAKGDKAAVVKYQKEIEKLKGHMAKAPSK